MKVIIVGCGKIGATLTARMAKEEHDVIVFVTGTDSSNGKVLSNLCRSHNPRTWNVTSPEEIDPSWFNPGERVGICGATSTPRWLLDEVAAAVTSL